MSNKAIIILSLVFVGLVVTAGGGWFAWHMYRSHKAQDPQVHFQMAAEAMEALDAQRLSILLDRYTHLSTTHLKDDGTTLLHRAMLSGGNVDYTRLLLDEGADANARDAEGRTPLHALCADPQTLINAEVVELLADHNADMNAADNAGNTPLSLMTLVRDVYSDAFPEIFQNISKDNRALLIQHGATEP